MASFIARPIQEADVRTIIQRAGGRDAHLAVSRRDTVGADFVLGESVIELKMLDEEGLDKSSRQHKLARLFRAHTPDSPVVVVDRLRLPSHAQHAYDRILDGPIKTAVAKARVQLKQSRSEHPDSRSSILFMVNNGYVALDHEDVVRMLLHRVRHDTDAIDGIVVGGCYHYSDTFDSWFLWPLEYFPVIVGHPFASFGDLKREWDDFAERFMTEVVLQTSVPVDAKPVVQDVTFSVDEIAFVKAAPSIGMPSQFFVSGRPRSNSTGLTKCPPIAIVFPGLSEDEWNMIRARIVDSEPAFQSLDEWRAERADALSQSSILRPTVEVPIACDEWQEWITERGAEATTRSVFLFATARFNQLTRAIIDGTREHRDDTVVPLRYVLAFTEEIGQDRAYDVSDIVLVDEAADGPVIVREFVTRQRIFHEHAVALGAAYAVQARVEFVVWRRDTTYAWA